MNTVPTGADSAPATISAADIDAVALAREAVARADEHGSINLDVDYVRDLLITYDKVAARLAWVAAQHAFCQMGGAE